MLRITRIHKKVQGLITKSKEFIRIACDSPEGLKVPPEPKTPLQALAHDSVVLRTSKKIFLKLKSYLKIYNFNFVIISGKSNLYFKVAK